MVTTTKADGERRGLRAPVMIEVRSTDLKKEARVRRHLLCRGSRPVGSRSRPGRGCDDEGGSRIYKDVLTSAFAIPTDEVLVTRARAGDIEALERMYRAFEVPVYNLARRLCRTREDAEDVLQETFLEVMRSIDRFRGEGSLAGWIRRVAASKALMRLRHRKYRDAEPFEDGGAEAATDSAWSASGLGGRALHAVPDRVDLEGALARLPGVSRAVVWLHDVEGYTHDEIASMMGKTPSFSKSQLARAHAHLRRWLAP